MIKRNKLFSCLLLLALVPGISSLSYAQEDGYSETEDRTKGVDPVGTVELKGKSVRLLIGASWGSGNLNFQGKDHTLKIKGMSAGGIGMVSVDATGDVYFLEDVSQFTGRYTAGTIGLTVAKGVGGAYFENANGVVMKLRAKSTGLALSLGLSGFDVEFAEQ
jgi:hypothetical protein